MSISIGADILVDWLARHGVRHVFGMPGSHSTAIYDALQRRGQIKTILTRNEQAGAFAADGYARVTGRPGVICTTAGPGATNALSGVAEAWADSVPLLLLTGHVNSDRMHLECGAYHEVDLEAILRPVTKWCGTVKRIEQIPEMVHAAFVAMTTGRPRPAALILPQDLMGGPCADFITPACRSSAPKAFSAPQQMRVGDESINRAADLLSQADRPIILAGGGALWAGAAAEIQAIAERLNAPVITSLNGKGIIDEDDPRSLGHARSARAKTALPHADAMLAVGCRFTEVMTDWRRMRVPAGLVQIDLEPHQIGMNYPAAVGIVADARVALAALLRVLPAARPNGWGTIWDEAQAARPAKPEWLIETLRAELPANSPVFTDACEIGYRMHTDWPVAGPRLFFYPSNYIALGWAFPAAVGAAVAQPDRHTVSVSGDGGFVMTAQELSTATRYGLRLIAVVHNDSTYGAIKNIQDRRYQGRHLDTDLNNPDFIKLAGAYGVPAWRVRTADELVPAVRQALALAGPSLIEVPDEWRFLRDLSNS
jgi:thiamine pyrophosphate-dependent acetolactate synthase large subunit-like protein